MIDDRVFHQKVGKVKTTVYPAVMIFFSISQFCPSAGGEEKDLSEVLFTLSSRKLGFLCLGNTATGQSGVVGVRGAKVSAIVGVCVAVVGNTNLPTE
jgi:hypothetical protein